MNSSIQIRGGSIARRIAQWLRIAFCRRPSGWPRSAVALAWMKMRPWVVAIVIATVLPDVTFGQVTLEPQQRKISVEQGRELIYTLLQPTGCTQTKCTVNLIENSYFPQFDFFYGFWANPVGS